MKGRNLFYGCTEHGGYEYHEYRTSFTGWLCMIRHRDGYLEKIGQHEREIEKLNRIINSTTIPRLRNPTAR